MYKSSLTNTTCIVVISVKLKMISKYFTKQKN